MRPRQSKYLVLTAMIFAVWRLEQGVSEQVSRQVGLAAAAEQPPEDPAGATAIG